MGKPLTTKQALLPALLMKLRASLRLPARGRVWPTLAREAAWSVPALLLIGVGGGIIRLGWTDDPAVLARLALVAIVVPAIGEELLFRAALLPSPAEPAPLWRSMLAIALFVLWHPLQALVFGPHWAATVLDPWFLACVAVLGAALTRLYLRTGSVWPGVLLHWAVVVAWKAFGGGPSPWVG